RGPVVYAPDDGARPASRRARATARPLPRDREPPDRIHVPDDLLAEPADARARLARRERAPGRHAGRVRVRLRRAPAADLAPGRTLIEARDPDERALLHAGGRAAAGLLRPPRGAAARRRDRDRTRELRPGRRRRVRRRDGVVPAA